MNDNIQPSTREQNRILSAEAGANYRKCAHFIEMALAASEHGTTAFKAASENSTIPSPDDHLRSALEQARPHLEAALCILRGEGE
ncbi:hypothetical protein DLJ53_20775 [Acuticoccus sediminis]|uniref:Uncharacterized protein n=1 Tax=Acuticoccus sediminis TaxID=2184697 RepID=A0A8B2NWR9_9HYPH|nr:hypothetical protein [Acuticoccus sediminis]RAI00147.1 hypothetical protein DLJ53_20775 [Acuticoccus sediminis]